MSSTARSAGTSRRATISASAVCDAWAAREPRRVAILNACRGARRRSDQLRLAQGDLQPARHVLLHARRRGAATGSRSCCRRCPKWRPIHIAIYKLGAVALPLAMLFGIEAIRYRLERLRRPGAHHRPAGAGQDGRDPRRPSAGVMLSVDVAGDGAIDFADGLRARHPVQRRGNGRRRSSE